MKYILIIIPKNLEISGMIDFCKKASCCHLLILAQPYSRHQPFKNEK